MEGGARETALNRSVIVVGTSSVQNKLLAKLIEARTGYACVCRPLHQLNGLPPAGRVLALIDADDLESCLALLAERSLGSNIAVINAEEDRAFEQFASAPGVKGVFFRETSEDNLVKGIEAIFHGDYWLPRRVLCAHLDRTRVLQRPAADAATLTMKEMETLRLLARGNSTERIARELKVSPHTVKTHIYNLYRKIHVSNRIQAVQWASHNMIIPGPWGGP
jgi:LuxR family transcriptional regulator, positive regulator of biofilm formation